MTVQPKALAVKQVPLDELKHDPNNVRRRDDAAVDAIANSLKRFGQQKPIVAQMDGTVIAGNGTLDAATKLGWKTIAVHFTELVGDEATAFSIADNRTADLAFWDEKGLLEQISKFQDPELVDFTAFSSNDIEQMMQGLSPDIGGDDDDDEDDEDKAIPDNSQDPDELSFQLVVTCKGEKDQAKLYEELSSRGYECRILML
tara:strand:+ start:13871 stop:14473 length:603 start_codon:yes stop_codon:yes gene_type:complete